MEMRRAACLQRTCFIDKFLLYSFFLSFSSLSFSLTLLRLNLIPCHRTHKLKFIYEKKMKMYLIRDIGIGMCYAIFQFYYIIE